MKENKGITLIALTITIIILVILAGVSLSGGVSAIQSSKDSKLKAQIDLVQHAVLERYTEYKTSKDEDLLVGTKLTFEEADAKAKEMEVMLLWTDGYYELTKEDLKEIGVDEEDDIYVVNYTSGEVMNTTHMRTSNGEALYRFGSY